MQIGLQKRLRARNSLFDLVGRRNIDRLSTPSTLSRSQDQSIEDIPSLPSSPPSSPSTPSLIFPDVDTGPASSEASSDPSQSFTMAPVRIHSYSTTGLCADKGFRKIPSAQGKKLEKTNMVRRTVHHGNVLLSSHYHRGHADINSAQAPSSPFLGTSSSRAGLPRFYLT